MTQHKIINGNSQHIDLPNNSIDLIVTSPPYPMIAMWDELFFKQDKTIKNDLTSNGMLAFYKMHAILNKTWFECDRVLKEDGIAIINIGDATRTINNFQLYSNHSYIINFFLSIGYELLPDIIWHKPSNAPNKFMGSGMLPCGAYVTYEHEYILIFRKNKRNFKDKVRQESAYFWEERNQWFTDIWHIKGTSQKTGNKRNASFPIEIPYRLINMYSVKNDTILDPFCGMGTTNLAAMINERNSIGIEINNDIRELAIDRLNNNFEDCNKIIQNRLDNHLNFITSLPQEKQDKCYLNTNHNFLVKTKQETKIKINFITKIDKGEVIQCHY